MTQVSYNSPYLEYKSLLFRLHSLVAQGEGSSAVARAIRDEMELPERQLTESEMDRLDGMSADLYMLQGREILEPGDVSPHLFQDSWWRGAWPDVLRLLRKRTPFTEANRAYLRAVAYDRMDDVDCACEFVKYAASLEPGNAVFQYFYLEYLMKLGRFNIAVAEACSHIKASDTASALLIHSATVLVQSVRDEPELEVVKRRCLEAREVLTAVLSRRSIAADTPVEVIALGYVLLGFCHEELNAHRAARRAYELALRIDSQNTAALIALWNLPRSGQPTADDLPVPSEAADSGPFVVSLDQWKQPALLVAA